MRKISIAFFLSLMTVAGVSIAQTQEPTSEIRESTDPAKHDEVLRRAAELESQQQRNAEISSGDSGTAKSKSSSSKRQMKSKRQGATSDTSGSSGAASGSAGGASGSNPQEGGSK